MVMRDLTAALAAALAIALLTGDTWRPTGQLDRAGVGSRAAKAFANEVLH
jgi:hypothetical protein